MTVNSSISSVSYASDSVTLTFPVPYYFLSDTHLDAVSVDNVTGETINYALGTDYTVSGAGVQSGGSVTFLSAVPTGKTIGINRNVPIDQQVAYAPNDKFPAKVNEGALDKLTMIDQQHERAIARSLQFPEPDGLAASAVFPPAVSRLGKVAVFDTTTGAADVSSEAYIEPSNLLDLAKATAEIIVGGVAPGSGTGTFIQNGVGAVVRTFQDKQRDVINVRDFGVHGSPTTALIDEGAKMDAAHRYVIDNGGTLVYPSLPAGYVYYHPAAVDLGTPGVARNGRNPWAIVGEAATPSDDSRGVTWLIDGAGLAYLVALNKELGGFGLMRQIRIKNSALATPTSWATYGLLTAGTFGGQNSFKDITVVGAVTSYAITSAVGGANGEFTKYIRCAGGGDRFFFQDTASAQAYEPVFEDCLFSYYQYDAARANSTLPIFEFGGAAGGFGLRCKRFNLSGAQQGTATSWGEKYFVKNNGTSDAVRFEDGRVENLTGILYNVAVPNGGAVISFEKIVFAALHCGPTTGALLKSDLTSPGGYLVTFDGCTIDGPADDTAYAAYDPILSINPNDGSTYDFRKIAGFSRAPKPTIGVGSVLVRGSRRVRSVTGNATRFQGPFGAIYQGAGANIGNRHLDESWDVQAGTAENLIYNSSFGSTFGTNIVAPSPWQHTGTSPNFPALFAADAAAPSRVQARIGPTSAVRQTLPHVTLTAGVPMWWVVCGIFQAQNPTQSLALYVLDGGNNVIGKVSVASTKGSVPIPIPICPQESGGSPTLVIENGDAANFFQLFLDWQFFTTKVDGAYVRPLPDAIITGSHRWNANPAQLRVTDRFALPLKPSSSGLTAPPADGMADMGVGLDTGRLHYVTPDTPGGTVLRVNAVRLGDYGTAPPTSGTFPAGWLRVNTADRVITNGRVVDGWLRLTTGGNHVIGVDWATQYAITAAS